MTTQKGNEVVWGLEDLAEYIDDLRFDSDATKAERQWARELREILRSIPAQPVAGAKEPDKAASGGTPLVSATYTTTATQKATPPASPVTSVHIQLTVEESTIKSATETNDDSTGFEFLAPNVYTAAAVMPAYGTGTSNVMAFNPTDDATGFE